MLRDYVRVKRRFRAVASLDLPTNGGKARAGSRAVGDAPLPRFCRRALASGNEALCLWHYRNDGALGHDRSDHLSACSEADPAERPRAQAAYHRHDVNAPEEVENTEIARGSSNPLKSHYWCIFLPLGFDFPSRGFGNSSTLSSSLVLHAKQSACPRGVTRPCRR
jgi:hypothetical protein